MLGIDGLTGRPEPGDMLLPRADLGAAEAGGWE